MKQIELIETMREYGKIIWLYETNQLPYYENELQQLKIIEENVLHYLEIVLHYFTWNYNSKIFPKD